MRALLNAAGVIALLLWTGAGAAAWFLVAQRVNVTVAEGRASDARQPDPAALLAEEVAAVQADMRALASAMESSVSELQQDVARQGAISAELRTLLQQANARDVERERAATPAAGAAHPPPAAAATVASEPVASEPVASEPVASEPVASEPVASAPTATEPIASAPTATEPVASAPTATEPVASASAAPESGAPAATGAEPTRRSFLAFRLPSSAFDFAAQHRFEIIPSLSRVGFDAKSTLHDFSGVTSQVSGAFTTSLAHPEEAPSGRIVARAAGLDTGLADRNAEMLEHLATREHAEIVFDVDGFRATQVDAAAQTVAGTVRGRMTIRGKTREIEMPLTLQVDASQRVVVTGSMALRLTDYEVPVPSKLGVIGMQDEVQVWVALRARPAGAVPTKD
jgi:polyisoprenoid-binding protein YceI